jgi:hypothetical protein
MPYDGKLGMRDVESIGASSKQSDDSIMPVGLIVGFLFYRGRVLVVMVHVKVWAKSPDWFSRIGWMAT